MHQCIKCKTIYENEEVPIVEGCPCGSRLFLFIKSPEDIEKAQQYKAELEQKIGQIEKQRKVAVKPGISAKKRPRKTADKTGIETIKVHDIGVYTINIDALMKGAPVIVLSKSGSYIISFPSLFGESAEVPLV